jgi:glutaredoxin
MGNADLLLITARDCHLCVHARSVLAALSLDAREVDVDSDEAAELAARGVALAFLPVLFDGERVLAYGRLSERRLRKDIER